MQARKIVDMLRTHQKANGRSLVFLILYVDDILLIGSGVPMLESVKNSVKDSFFYEGLRISNFYLGYEDL